MSVQPRVRGGAAKRPEASRLLVVSDRITATQFISFLQPLQALIEAGRMSLHLLDCPGKKDEVCQAFRDARPDCLILSRCTQAIAREFVLLARENGIPYVYHIDDDLLNVPASLGLAKFKAYNDPKRRGTLESLMRAADVVYASTAPLKTALGGIASSTRIVSGDVYCCADGDRLAEAMRSPWPVIGYMGTSGHGNDLNMVLPAIAQLMEEFPHLRFEVFGSIEMPAALQCFGTRIAAHPPDLNYVGFVDRLQALGWWIGLAPLEDNAFNRCKADTKWVEYASAGMAVVASDLPVYHRACAGGAGLLVPDGGDWHGAIRGLLVNGPQRAEMIARARARLLSDYRLESLQDQLLAVLEQARALAAVRTREANTASA